MSVGMIDAVGRMQNIQTALDRLSATATAPRDATTKTASANSGADFSALFNKVLGANGALPLAGAGVAGSEGVTGDAVVEAAKKYIGVPYVFGGEDANGMDCSGLVQRVYADLGIEVPRLVSGQMTAGTEVPSLAQAQPGDLIVTDNADHIVIYAGNNKVIHAPYEGRTVSYVERWFDESDIVTIRRIVPTDGTQTASLGSRSIDALGGQNGRGVFGQGLGQGLDLQSLLSSFAGQQTNSPNTNEALIAAARSAMLSGGTR